VIAAAALFVGVICAVIAGNNPRSVLATTAGSLFIVAILVALACVTAALWQRLRKGKHDDLRQRRAGPA
jgi:hypothetical protein